MQPEISVIVPVYNVEKYLETCLDSILAQSFCNFELILIDDGSTDSSGIICDRYHSIFPLIQVIHRENGGLSAARNTGMDYASGSFLCFIDSDDRIHPDYLRILHNIAITSGADVSFCGFREWDGSEAVCTMTEKAQQFYFMSKPRIWEKLTHTGPDASDALLFITACNKLIRRACVKNIRFPEGVWHEDEFWAHRLLAEANSYAGTDLVLYDYRKRAESITGTDNRLDPRHLDLISAMEERIEYSRTCPDPDLFPGMVHAYRNQLIILYHQLQGTSVSGKIRKIYLRSFLQKDRRTVRVLRSELIFLLSPAFYYRRYW